MISDYKAIIFDWDGTLVDTCSLILDAHNHVRKHYGHPLWTMNDFLGQASQSAREYYPTIYGEEADKAQKILYAYVTKHHLNYLDPMDQAFELLSFLEDSDVPMGVVSNKRHNTLNIEIDHVGWRPYFQTAIGAGKAETDKPSIAPLLMALGEMNENLQPKDILYIGDTETDLICAQNAGSDIVFIQSDKPRPDLIAKYAPNYAFHDLGSFLDEIKDQSPSLNKAC